MSSIPQMNSAQPMTGLPCFNSNSTNSAVDNTTCRIFGYAPSSARKDTWTETAKKIGAIGSVSVPCCVGTHSLSDFLGVMMADGGMATTDALIHGAVTGAFGVCCCAGAAWQGMRIVNDQIRDRVHEYNRGFSEGCQAILSREQEVRQQAREEIITAHQAQTKYL